MVNALLYYECSVVASVVCHLMFCCVSLYLFCSDQRGPVAFAYWVCDGHPEHVEPEHEHIRLVGLQAAK